MAVSAGIRPRDELARLCGLEVGERGGIVVGGQLQTSDPDIYAVGECALAQGMTYGLAAPGYRMAEAAVAHILAEGDRAGLNGFRGADMSTKLKLLGVDVASVGDSLIEDGDERPLGSLFGPSERHLQEAVLRPEKEHSQGRHPRRRRRGLRQHPQAVSEQDSGLPGQPGAPAVQGRRRLRDRRRRASRRAPSSARATT